MLSWKARISYGLGHVLNDITASLWFSYLIVYMEYVLCIDTSIAGVLVLIGQVVDAICTPLIGYESDVTCSEWCSRYGRRKALHLLGSICVIFSFPFIFIRCPGCEDVSNNWSIFIYLVPFVVIFQFGWAATQVAHLSLIPILSQRQSERDLLSSIRNAFDMFADVIAFALTWLVLSLLTVNAKDRKDISPDDAYKFTVIALIVSIIGVLTTFVFHVSVQHKSSASGLLTHSDSGSSDSSTSSGSHLMIEWSDWLRNYKFYLVSTLYTATRLIQNLSLVYIPLYLQEFLRTPQDYMAKVPLVMNSCGCLASCMLHVPMEKCGKKCSYFFAAVLGLFICIWLSVAEGPFFRYQGIYIAAAVLGTSISIMNVCSLAFIADLIGTDTERGSFVYGTMSFAEKLANGLCVLFIQYMHSIECNECNWFYRGVVSYAVGGIILFSILMMAIMVPLDLQERPVNGSTTITGKISYRLIDAATPGKASKSPHEASALLRRQ